MFLVLALLLPLVSALVAKKILAVKASRSGFGRENSEPRLGEFRAAGDAAPAKCETNDDSNPARVGGHGLADGFAVNQPLRTFLKNYAFVLATSLALTYLLAAGVVSRLSVVDILFGQLGFFNTEILTLSAVLLAANLAATLILIAAWGGARLRRPTRAVAVWAFLFAVLILLRLSLHWAFRTFPLQDANMVFGVMEAPLGNAPEIFARLWVKKALVPALLVFAALMPSLLQLLASKFRKVVPYSLAVILLLTLYAVSENVPLMAYYQKSLEVKPGNAPKFTTEFSPFYKAHYVFPDSVKLAAPKEKRNLLFIFLESMEASFQDSANGGLHAENFIPEITELAKRHLNFSGGQLVGGGTDVLGTGWTVAATIAKFMGMPLLKKMPLYNISQQNDPNFRPHAVGLTDILAREGYYQSYVIGSLAEFHNRNQLFRVHGNVLLKDLAHYKASGKIPEDYLVYWGFEDSKLFEFLKEELDSVSRLDQPFAVYTLTTNTHMPEGYFEEAACPEFAPKVKTEEENYKAALRCSSKQVGRFMRWVERQKWFKHTTVVVVGDHLWPFETLIPAGHQGSVKTFIATDLGAISDIYRRWLCIYINPELEPATRFRQFSSFDIFPSTLEALGFEVPGHALGFGRSLFSSESTLVERFGEAEINRNFQKRTPEYLYLMDEREGYWE